MSSGLVITVLVALVISCSYFLWTLRTKLQEVKAALAVSTEKQHEHTEYRLQLVGTRLNTYCRCGSVVRMFLCIPVGENSTGVVYGPQVESVAPDDG